MNENTPNTDPVQPPENATQAESGIPSADTQPTAVLGATTPLLPPPAAPGYGAPGYGAPAYGAPTYGAPGAGGNAYPPPAAYPPAGYPPVPPAAARLTRSRSDRMLGGVCGGLARYWNTDATLLRILTVVLTIVTGGALLIGYIIAWIAIPDEGSPYGPGGQYPGGTRTDASGAAQVGYAAGGNPAFPDPMSPYAGYSPPPAPPRQRSYLGWLVVSIALLVMGVLAVIGILAPDASSLWSLSTFAVASAVVLVILGVGLVVGTWVGRARWLTILAVPLAFVSFGVIAADQWVQDNPNLGGWSDSGTLAIGERQWVVTAEDLTGSPLEYRLSAGDATLDLTGLAGLETVGAQDAQEVTIDARIGLGELVVLIPADMAVELDATVSAGEVHLPATAVISGTNLDVQKTVPQLKGDEPAVLIHLDAAIGAGNLEVRRAAA